MTLITLLKDIRLWLSSKNHSAFQHSHLWQGKKAVFVWEHHDIFPGPGRKLAAQLKVPLIKYVHAPQIWESRKWGVKRPIWGKLLERFFEVKSLNQGDVVACVSKEVEMQLEILGVKTEKLIVSPMAVDPVFFSNLNSSGDLRQYYKLTGKFVIGWTGSFRNFHGLDLLVMAFKIVNQQFPESLLMLVGDGLERKKIETQVSSYGLTDKVIFTGRKSFLQIPEYINLFDISVVSARSAEGFHYSPLKLREYMVSGKATITARAGDVEETFSEGRHLLLYEAGNVDSMAANFIKLMKDPSLRVQLAANGKNFVLETGTWTVELRKILKKI